MTDSTQYDHREYTLDGVSARPGEALILTLDGPDGEQTEVEIDDPSMLSALGRCWLNLMLGEWPDEGVWDAAEKPSDHMEYPSWAESPEEPTDTPEGS